MSTQLELSVEIDWILSQSASCFHAADLLRRGQDLSDPVLVSAIAEPTQRLCRQIDALGLDQCQFWRHLVPLAAGIENNEQLARVVLCKLIGMGGRAPLLLEPLAGRIADVEAALRRSMPGLLDDMSSGAEWLRKQWSTWGSALLRGMAQLTDERLIVPRADVVAVHPVQDGGGLAHLPYNSVTIEAVSGNSDDLLPEVMRLAWLVAQLNCDLPIFGERVHPVRLPVVASLAMLPCVLTAAEQMEMSRSEPATIQRAVDMWLADTQPGADLVDLLVSWWETYGASRPAWAVALAALDQMLADG